MCVSIDFVYKLLIICIGFDSLFSRLILPLNGLKYLVVSFLIFWIIKTNQFRVSIPIKNRFVKFYVLLTSFSVLISLPFCFDYGFAGLDVPKKYFFFIISVICSYYAPKFGIARKELLRFFAKIELVWAIMNPVLYFLSPPIFLNGAQRWYGRISVGYPTIDVVLYSVAIVIFLFDEDNQQFYKRRILASVILLIGIASQSSGTGIVLSVVIFMIYFVTLLPLKINRNVRYKRNKTLLLVSLFLLSTVSAITVFQKVDEVLYEKMVYSVENRVGILLGEKNVELDVNTLDMRAQEFNDAKKMYQNTITSQLFGVGFGPINYRPDRNKAMYETVFLENQFHMFLFSQGFLGVAVFVLVLISVAYQGIKKINMVLFGCLLVIFFGFFTSVPLMDFPIVSLLGLLFVMQEDCAYAKKKCCMIERSV